MKRTLFILLLLGLALLPEPIHSLPFTDPMVEVSSFAPDTMALAPEQIRIVSYNLHGPPTERIDDLTDVLTSHPAIQDASIFALQEVNRHHGETAYKDMARELAREMGVYYAFATENPYSKGGGVRGLAIFSRFPLSEVERTVLPVPGPGGRRRITLGATIPLGSKQVRVYTLHLETRISVEERGQQISEILTQAERYRDMPTIILGDFNTITDGARKKMTDLFTGAGYTCPLAGDTMTFQRAMFLRLKLDWIWVRNVKVKDANVEREITASDHRPVWADMVLTSD